MFPILQIKNISYRLIFLYSSSVFTVVKIVCNNKIQRFWFLGHFCERLKSTILYVLIRTSSYNLRVKNVTVVLSYVVSVLKLVLGLRRFLIVMSMTELGVPFYKNLLHHICLSFM